MFRRCDWLDEPQQVYCPRKARAIEDIRWPGSNGHHLCALFNKLVQGKASWPLFLWGRPGRGKTCAILCMVDRVQSAHYVRCKEHVNYITDATYGRIRDDAGVKVSREVAWDRWIRAPLAVVDDLGSSLVKGATPSESYMNVIHELLEQRGTWPTAVVSNIHPGGIEEIFGEAIASRLTAGSVFELYGPDRRKQLKQATAGGQEVIPNVF